jgi:hypothetical protein
MPNVVVDLGYYSPYFWQIGGVSATPTQNDAYASGVHARTVAKLDDGLNWTVGRLFSWMGDLNDYAYGFAIYHLDGTGSPTGKEFLIMFAGRSDSQNDFSAAPGEVFQSSALFESYFKNSGATNFNGFQVIHYHSGGLLGSTYDIDESLAHLAPPATNPDTDPVAFMPTFATKPYPKGGSRNGASIGDGGGTFDPKWCLVANEDEPFIAMYCNRSNNRHVCEIFITGDIIDPRAAADIYPEATLQISVATSFSVSTDSVQILTDLGAQEEVLDS